MKWIGLMITIVFSYWLSSFYTQYGGSNWKNFDLAIGPGIVFSSYVVLLFRKDKPWLRSVLYFVFLSLTYFLLVVLSFATWGAAVVPAGVIGACILKCVLEDQIKFRDVTMLRFALIGFITGLLGWGGFHLLLNEVEKEGAAIGAIVVAWQFFIGAEVIRYHKTKNRETN